MRNRSRLLALAAVIPLGACCTPPPPRIIVKDLGCEWAKPITVSKNDTKETKVQAIAQYDTYVTRCPK